MSVVQSFLVLQWGWCSFRGHGQEALPLVVKLACMTVFFANNFLSMLLVLSNPVSIPEFGSTAILPGS